MECFRRPGDRIRGRGSRSTRPTIGAIPQRAQHLASFLKVTAPEKRGALTCETIGLVCAHFPVSDNHARGRRRTVMGAPECLACLALIEPVNHRERAMRGCHGGMPGSVETSIARPDTATCRTRRRHMRDK